MNVHQTGMPNSVRISVKWLDKLSPYELRMYIVMKVMQSQGRKISYESLSNALGLAHKLSVKAHLQALIGMGLITRIPPAKSGRGHSYTYQINDNVGN